MIRDRERPDHVGQLWEVVTVGNGPWLVVGWSPDLVGIESWEIVSLSTLVRARASESSLSDSERAESFPWERVA